MKVHPTAIVDEGAILAPDVEIGPFCIVESGVEVGPGCRLAARVSLKRGVVLGRDNVISEGAVLGGAPQHICSPKEHGGVLIGNGNVIRENCTIHCAMYPENQTRVGDHNFIMVNAHVAHDCVVGNHVILTNNVMLAGHVRVEDRANVSGGVAVHQFCQIGMYAMVGGLSHIVQDVPPFVNVDGGSSLVVGINLIGLRRGGVSNAEIRKIWEAYHCLYEEKRAMHELEALLRERFPEGLAGHFADFIACSKRGFISERRTSGKMLKFVRVDSAETPKSAPAASADAPAASPAPGTAADPPAETIRATG